MPAMNVPARDKEDTRALIRQAQEGDAQAEARLVEDNIALVHSVSRRFRDRGYEYEDIFQLGCVGLVKAIRNFNLSFDVCFSTYAVPMIMGEIRRFLRDDGPIKVSRTLKERSRLLMAANEKLKELLMRQPTVVELAQELGCEQEEIAQIMEATAPVGSIDDELEGKDGTMRLANTISDERNTPEGEIDRIVVSQLLDKLDERDRRIIYLRFFQERTQSEIAREIGVSQVQISRIETRVLKRLREMLQSS